MKRYAILKLAYQSGRFDVRRVADEIRERDLAEWVAFGALEGWFPRDEKPSKKAMTASESLEYFRGNKNYSHIGIQAKR